MGGWGAGETNSGRRGEGTGEGGGGGKQLQDGGALGAVTRRT